MGIHREAAAKRERHVRLFQGGGDALQGRQQALVYAVRHRAIPPGEVGVG
jgi:hypothetical protein